ncbi:hypothetical protein [Singulisphaera sp. PoT]
MFDEIALLFPNSIRAWLKGEIPENLAAQTSKAPSINDIFNFED